MSKAIRLTTTGGPEVLTWVDVEVGEPGPGEVRLRQEAVGLNFIDIYFRSGQFRQPLPSGLGTEAAGTIEAVGAGVARLRAGDRVAYGTSPQGAYAERRLLPSDCLVKLPDAISFEQGASMILRGLTAQALLRQTFRVREGDAVLIHAAAGGVGLIAVQWAKALGATVIGTVGSDEKAELACSMGCDVVVVYTREDFVDVVKRATRGKGVSVVYDSVGKDTFMKSLDCLRPLGTMVNFGSSSGVASPLELVELTRRGSLSLVRPTLSSYVTHGAGLEAMASELFQMVLSGRIRVDVHQRYRFDEVVRAHADLEGRRTRGSSVMVPANSQTAMS